MSKRPPHTYPTQRNLKLNRNLESIGLVFFVFLFLAAVHVAVNVMPYDMANFLETTFEAVREIFVS